MYLIELRPCFCEAVQLLKPFLKWIANRYSSRHAGLTEFDDLYQVALLGAWRAYQTCRDWAWFKPYAKKRIRYDLWTYLAEHDAPIPMTRYRRSLLTTEQRREWREGMGQPLSLDAPRSRRLDQESAPGTFAEQIPAPAPDLDLAIDVRQALARLTPPQAAALVARHMHGHTASSWARQTGVRPQVVDGHLRLGMVNFRLAWAGQPVHTRRCRPPRHLSRAG